MLRIPVKHARLISLIITILVGVGAWWYWFRTLPAVYVAVVRPELAEGVPSELADTLRLSITAEVGRCRSTYTLRSRDIDNVKGDSEMIARVLGADEMVYTKLSPSAAGFRVELVREVVSFDDQGEFISDKSVATFPAPDSPRPLLSVIKDHLSRLYGNRRRPFSSSPGGDYIAYARLWGQVGRPGTDYDDLLAELEKLRESGSSPVEAYHLEASISRYLYQVTFDAKYITRARDVLKKAPDDPALLFTAVEVEQAAGEQERALEVLEEAREAVPDAPHLWFFEAKANEDTNIEKALWVVSQARETVFSLHELSRLEAMIGLYEEARENLEKALSYAPDDLLLKERLAHLELVTGNLIKAEELFAALSTLEPGQYSNHVNLAAIQILSGRYEGAIAKLEDIADLGYRKPITYLNLGDAYQLLGNNHRAEEAYQKTIEVSEDSNNPLDLGFRAQALAHLGMKSKATDTINKALELAETPEVLYSSSVVHVVSGNTAKSKEIAKKAVARGMGAHWFNLPWFDGMGIADYADGRIDERQLNRTEAVQLRDHPTKFSRIKEGCSIIFWLLAKGDVGGVAKEVSAIISEVETKAVQYLKLAIILGALLFFVFTAAILQAILLNHKLQENERQTERKNRATKKSLEEALDKLKTLENLRDLMKLDLSSVNETWPTVSVALNRGAFLVRSGKTVTGLRRLQEAIEGFNEMSGVLSELEETTTQRT